MNSLNKEGALLLTPQRKRLLNQEKIKIIEDSKKPGFCRKTTITHLEGFFSFMNSCNVFLFQKFAEKASHIVNGTYLTVRNNGFRE